MCFARQGCACCAFCGFLFLSAPSVACYMGDMCAGSPDFVALCSSQKEGEAMIHQ